MAQTKIPTDHTEGSIIKSVLSMGLPSMLGFGIGNIYDLIDMFWLSRLGPEPVAAITILGPSLWVLHSANTIVGVGSVAIISRRYGEKDIIETEMSIKETIILKLLAGIFFGIIGFIFTPFILNLLGAKGEVLEAGIVYGRIIFAGMGFNFATYSIFTALRGTANPNIAMTIMFALSGLNMLLDPFMIFGWWIFPAMGVAGAAWATVIAYAVAFLTGLVILYMGKGNVRLHFRNARPVRWQTMWQILKIGLPSAIGQVSFSLARLVIMPMITIFGTAVVAAYGVSQRVSSLGITLLVGIGLGLSALIGHNLGAGKLDRARKTADQAILLSTGIMTALGIITFIFAAPIMRIFFRDPDIVGYGVSILRILAIGFPFLGLSLMMENVYTGAGENRPAMIYYILQAWCMEIPGVYLTTQILHLDQNAVWWTMTATIIISVLAFYLYFRRGKWLHVKV